MSKIKLLAQTNRTVTLHRADFEALLEAAEDKSDLAAVRNHRAHERRAGWPTARRDYLTRTEAERALAGESLVRIWRQKRGMNQRALAEAARVSTAYLAEIEAGKKPGSKDAVQRLAQILEVPMENLMSDDKPAAPAALRPVTRSDKAAARLAKLAEEDGEPEQLADEARRIVAEWIGIADRDGVRHQVNAAIWALRSTISEMSAGWAQRSIEQDRIHDIGAARRMRRISVSLEAAIDALATESRAI